MTRPTITAHSLRVCRLDADGQPTGDSVELATDGFLMTTKPAPLADPKEHPTMPTERTLAQHRKRWQTAEAALARALADRDTARAERDSAEQQAVKFSGELHGLDLEARLLADLEAAVAAHQQRVRLADEAAERERRRSSDGYGYAMASTDYVRSEPTRPALDSPLGRALLHLAARYGLAIEATVLYPDPTPEQQLVSVPRHVAEQLQRMPMEAWAR